MGSFIKIMFSSFVVVVVVVPVLRFLLLNPLCVIRSLSLSLIRFSGMKEKKIFLYEPSTGEFTV